ncbi:MAG TPA: 16S rRNA (adenine(1518)-N(6)/adenine(1519)-N(6))-dimethyltransferase RsmA [Sandaracinaceae bacterium]
MRAPPAWEDPRRALRRHGLAPKRAFSQNFLVSRTVVERIASALAPRPDELTVELGAGLGTLTAALLRAGGRVLAIERDRDMLAVLRADLGGVEGLEVHEGDAAAIDLSALAREHGPLALAGNLPYAVTGAILENLVRHRAALGRAVVMVQREVRDRLIAAPGTKAYGALTVFVQAGFEVEPVMRVPAGAFHPPPKVESAVVRLVPRAAPRAEETEAFRTVVHAAFRARRKTLRNALKAIGAEGALEATGIDGNRRGETLSIEELAALAAALDQRTPS